MQAFAGQVERDGDLGAIGMRMHAHRRPLRRNVRAVTGDGAQLIADRVLQAQRTEARVRDLGMFAGEVAGQRARRVDVRAPVDGARRLVERRVAGRFEFRDHQEHARGDA